MSATERNKFQWQRKVWEAEDLSVYDKAVLLNLGLYFHNEQTGRCNPSILTISQKINCSRSAVKRAIRKLEALGWLIVVRHLAGGDCNPNDYRPNFDGPHRTVQTVLTDPQTEYPNTGVHKEPVTMQQGGEAAI